MTVSVPFRDDLILKFGWALEAEVLAARVFNWTLSALCVAGIVTSYSGIREEDTVSAMGAAARLLVLALVLFTSQLPSGMVM